MCMKDTNAFQRPLVFITRGPASADLAGNNDNGYSTLMHFLNRKTIGLQVQKCYFGAQHQVVTTRDIHM